MTQEPVAWVSEDVCEGQYINGRPRKIWWECEKGVGTAFYTYPPQSTEQEPVAWMFQHDETGRMNYVSNDGIHNPTMFLEMNPRYALVCPLYTTPPQRTWVGLTDEEIELAMAEPTLRKIYHAIEAKLKELNT